MCRVISKAAIACLLIFAFVSPVIADEMLVSINGVEYTDQDYRVWWKYWQEPGMDFFDTPEEFVDFHLLAQQGRQMEFQLTPQFQRTVEVFVKVKALNRLRYEEVNKKIKVTEEQVRARFKEEYSPIWTVQLLAYGDQSQAQAVVEQMKPYAGQAAGRLVFADISGVKPEEGGPLHYEELELFPARIRQDSEFWLPVLSALDKGQVSEPLYIESRDRYYLIRMDDIREPDELLFGKNQQRIGRDLEKEQSKELTGMLMERLIEKYHLEVDWEFVESLEIDKDYPEDILEKPVIRLDDFDFTARLFIQNVKTQQKQRANVSDEELKRMVVQFFISQTLTDKEALSRHYEERPPFKSEYEFYINNTLRKSLLSDIRQKIEVSDEEIKAYYDNNSSLFIRPGKLSYAVIHGEEDLLHEISRVISRGGDFYVEAQKYSLDAEMASVRDDGQENEILKELAKLGKGDVSKPFKFGASHVLIKMLDRKGEKITPLEQVRAEIKKRLLEEKFKSAEKDYLKKAKALSDIKINRDLWQKLKEEYEDA